jgi:hypothetical protein
MTISTNAIGEVPVAAPAQSDAAKRPPAKRVVVAEPDPRETAQSR